MKTIGVGEIKPDNEKVKQRLNRRTLRASARDVAASQMPKWRARKDSRGVRAVRRSVALVVSEMNNKRRGNRMRHMAKSSSL